MFHLGKTKATLWFIQKQKQPLSTQVLPSIHLYVEPVVFVGLVLTLYLA